MTITECGGRPTVRKVSDADSRKMLAFFEQPYLAVRSVDRPVAEKAHDLSRRHGLKHMDAIHVATAVLSGAEVLYTYDAAKGSQAGLLSHDGASWLGGLPILRPPDPASGTVFDPTIRGDP